MYVIIENHFIKSHCFNYFMELAEEFIEHCKNIKGCLAFNVFERKSVESQAIIISYWDKTQNYVQFLKTQKAIYLKNRLRTALERAPHVDIYYSLSSASGARAHHFKRASLNHKAQKDVYTPAAHIHHPYLDANAAAAENREHDVQENLNEHSQFFIHLSQRYINVSTSTELLMKMREEERERKRLEMLEEQRKQYRQYLLRNRSLNVKTEVSEIQE